MPRGLRTDWFTTTRKSLPKANRRLNSHSLGGIYARNICTLSFLSALPFGLADRTWLATGT
eukprot:scaffold139785_cov24-Prasinocladus_malaysianus.AAC.1